MGTNYYWYPPVMPPCHLCGRSYEVEPLHIGKSSAGWCFSLHVIPAQGFYDLPDWEATWLHGGGAIKNEYDETITHDQMSKIIRERSGPRTGVDTFDYAANHGEPGPNGLIRHRIGPYCVGHGAGTWDLIPSVFS